MAYMRISCAVCGRGWEVYGRTDLDDKRARSCPHCDSRINRKTWEQSVLPALRAFENANIELSNDNFEHHIPLFQFDLYSNLYYKGGCEAGWGTEKEGE